MCQDSTGKYKTKNHTGQAFGSLVMLRLFIKRIAQQLKTTIDQFLSSLSSLASQKYLKKFSMIKSSHLSLTFLVITCLASLKVTRVPQRCSK